MNKKIEKDTLLAAFEGIIAEDPCTVQLHGLTNLGLVELTRQRRTPPLQQRLDLALDQAFFVKIRYIPLSNTRQGNIFIL